LISERTEILKGLGAGPIVLRRLVRDLDDSTIRTRPAESEWAIVEVVAHLADTEERALARTRRMLTEAEPSLPGYDPDTLAIERGYLAMDVATELDRFERLRLETTDLLASLDDAGWQRTGLHGEHGLITVQQLAAHTAGEDADHFAQIARIIPERRSSPEH
jgi:hypothetical protein